MASAPEDPALPPVHAHWLPDQFSSFTQLHLLTVGVCLSLIAVVVALGAGWRRDGGDGERRLRFVVAIGAIVYWIVSNLYWLLGASPDWGRNLPLHICDVAGLLAPISLLCSSRSAGSKTRLLRTIVYFWGFALCSQAFFTPVVTEGPARIEFWLFWINHTIIVGAAVYEVVVRGYRPRFVDLAAAVGLTIAYLAVMFVLNIATGWNYAYVGNSRPESATLLDVLGPWPWRIGPLIALGTLSMALCWAPWAIARRTVNAKERGNGK